MLPSSRARTAVTVTRELPSSLHLARKSGEWVDSLRARRVHAQSGRSSREHPPALRWTNPFRIRRQFYEAARGVSMKVLGRFVKKPAHEVLTPELKKPLNRLFLIQVRWPWCTGRVFGLRARRPPGRPRTQRLTGRSPHGRWSAARRYRQKARYGCRQCP